MIEAVGHENLPAYFDAISGLLKPGGQAVIQVSTPLCIFMIPLPCWDLTTFSVVTSHEDSHGSFY